MSSVNSSLSLSASTDGSPIQLGINTPGTLIHASSQTASDFISLSVTNISNKRIKVWLLSYSNVNDTQHNLNKSVSVATVDPFDKSVLEVALFQSRGRALRAYVRNDESSDNNAVVNQALITGYVYRRLP